MLAAENGGLPGGKVGGMGDVVRDLPRALARRGYAVTVVTPAYGFLARLPDVEACGTVSVRFAGETIDARRLKIPTGQRNLEYELFDHPRFAPAGEERIYHDDAPQSPFATDATKFALFCALAARHLSTVPDQPDLLHLHDWHTGYYFLLREFDASCRVLQTIRTVFTIHNLALQGTRPATGSDSSLEAWFPDLAVPQEVIDDPQYSDCINPMAAAIRLADAVTTVSPTYATEIVQPSDPSTGFHGGEALESLLAARDREGALIGILNGCAYPDTELAAPSWKEVLSVLESELSRWIARDNVVSSAAYLADRKLPMLPKRRPPVVATSIGRATEQKLGLFVERVWHKSTALDYVLKFLDKGVFIMLGSGDARFERFLQEAMVRHRNFLFLRGYSDKLAEALYAVGDVFLMPSVFEPCGISQMLAMRAGQPVVAHAVGGLRDTVTAGSGFPFTGSDSQQQARNFVHAVASAVERKLTNPEAWEATIRAAKDARFTWDDSAERYLTDVYGLSSYAGERDVNVSS
jgi:starch synthase